MPTQNPTTNTTPTTPWTNNNVDLIDGTNWFNNNTTGVTTSVSYQFINDVVLTQVQSKENELRAYMAGLGPNPNTQDLLIMQQMVHQWTLVSDLHSTFVKQLSETHSKIMQKTN